MIQAKPRLLITALLLLACDPQSSAPVKDNSIEPQRILSLAPSHSELIFALGLGARLVGRTDRCDHPPEIESVPSIGSLFPPSYERILARRPDLILMMGGSEQIRRKLRALGLQVEVIQPKSLEELRGEILRLGRLLGREAQAKILEGELGAALTSLPKLKTRPRLFYEVWPEPLQSVGPETFLHSMIEAAGGENVVKRSGWPRYPLESLIKADPDLILTPKRESFSQISQRPGWSELRAVKAGRVYLLPNSDWFARPGPRVIKGLKWLSQVLKQQER